DRQDALDLAVHPYDIVVGQDVYHGARQAEREDPSTTDGPGATGVPGDRSARRSTGRRRWRADTPCGG
ncbi:hypothetical protein ACFV0M_39210, partial [Streptomyces vinaceus]